MTKHMKLLLLTILAILSQITAYSADYNILKFGPWRTEKH